MRPQHTRGFTLLIAIITTSVLLLVSFVVANMALNQVVVTLSSQASQHAFYAADSASECAMYWDIKNPGNTSGLGAFDLGSSQSSVTCNGSTIILSSTTPVVNGSVTTFTTTFSAVFPDGCADVSVTKTATVISASQTDTQTQINAQGYNTCDVSSLRRFARGITINY